MSVLIEPHPCFLHPPSHARDIYTHTRVRKRNPPTKRHDSFTKENTNFTTRILDFPLHLSSSSLCDNCLRFFFFFFFSHYIIFFIGIYILYFYIFKGENIKEEETDTYMDKKSTRKINISSKTDPRQDRFLVVFICFYLNRKSVIIVIAHSVLFRDPIKYFERILILI